MLWALCCGLCYVLCASVLPLFIARLLVLLMLVLPPNFCQISVRFLQNVAFPGSFRQISAKCLVICCQIWVKFPFQSGGKSGGKVLGKSWEKWCESGGKVVGKVVGKWLENGANMVGKWWACGGKPPAPLTLYI